MKILTQEDRDISELGELLVGHAWASMSEIVEAAKKMAARNTELEKEVKENALADAELEAMSEADNQAIKNLTEENKKLKEKLKGKGE